MSKAASHTRKTARDKEKETQMDKNDAKLTRTEETKATSQKNKWTREEMHKCLGEIHKEAEIKENKNKKVQPNPSSTPTKKRESKSCPTKKYREEMLRCLVDLLTPGSNTFVLPGNSHQVSLS